MREMIYRAENRKENMFRYSIFKGRVGIVGYIWGPRCCPNQTGKPSTDHFGTFFLSRIGSTGPFVLGLLFVSGFAVVGLCVRCLVCFFVLKCKEKV